MTKGTSQAENVLVKRRPRGVPKIMLETVEYIPLAHMMGPGNMTPDGLKIRKIKM